MDRTDWMDLLGLHEDEVPRLLVLEPDRQATARHAGQVEAAHPLHAADHRGRAEAMPVARQVTGGRLLVRGRVAGERGVPGVVALPAVGGSEDRPHLESRGRLERGGADRRRRLDAVVPAPGQREEPRGEDGGDDSADRRSGHPTVTFTSLEATPVSLSTTRNRLTPWKLVWTYVAKVSLLTTAVTGNSCQEPPENFST